MKALIALMQAHQVLFTLAGGFLWSAFISALPEPTSTSGNFYNFIFKFFNVLAANISRAKNSTVESSPNFIPAAQKAQDLGQLSS
jgi:hypothetical protein